MPSGNCLEGYTMRGAEADSTRRSPGCRRFSKSARRSSGSLNTQSVYAQVDENGRIVLPQRLREQIGLADEAYFAGMGEHFQILGAGGLRAPTWPARRLARRARRGRDPFAALDAMDREDGS